LSHKSQLKCIDGFHISSIRDISLLTYKATFVRISVKSLVNNVLIVNTMLVQTCCQDEHVPLSWVTLIVDFPTCDGSTECSYIDTTSCQDHPHLPFTWLYWSVVVTSPTQPTILRKL